MQYLLLLGAEQAYRERATVAALRCSNHPIACISPNSKMNRNRMFDLVLHGDPMDLKSGLDAVTLFEEKTGQRPLAVVPLNDWTLKTGHGIARKYDLPYLSLKTIERARNKSLMKKSFLEAGLPAPRFSEFTTYEELKEKMAEFAFPVVIKPIDFGGSGGVVRVDRMEDLEKAFKHTSSILKQYAEMFHVSSDTYLLEECIDSEQEVSVEVLNIGNTRQVIAVTEKYLGPYPHYAEIAHLVPSPNSDDNNLKTLAIKVCDVLGITMGVAHVEIKIKEGELFLMEVGARPAGGGIMDLVERVYRVNPYTLHIITYLGNAEELPPIHPRGSAAICGLKAFEGRIDKIEPPKSLPDEVDTLYITAKEGDHSEPPICWRSREGIIEFFWPNKIFGEKTMEHINIANALSAKIFTVSA